MLFLSWKNFSFKINKKVEGSIMIVKNKFFNTHAHQLKSHPMSLRISKIFFFDFYVFC